MRWLLLSSALLCLLAIAGCGSVTTVPDCYYASLAVSPSAATADHAASPPGNSQRFLAWGHGTKEGCFTLQSNLSNVTWSVSDTLAVTISNAQDPTYGLATCVNSTLSPVTVTATLPADKNSGHQITGTATLSCN